MTDFYTMVYEGEQTRWKYCYLHELTSHSLTSFYGDESDAFLILVDLDHEHYYDCLKLGEQHISQLKYSTMNSLPKIILAMGNANSPKMSKTLNFQERYNIKHCILLTDEEVIDAKEYIHHYIKAVITGEELPIKENYISASRAKRIDTSNLSLTSNLAQVPAGKVTNDLF
jgi:hypothetical protein